MSPPKWWLLFKRLRFPKFKDLDQAVQKKNKSDFIKLESRPRNRRGWKCFVAELFCLDLSFLLLIMSEVFSPQEDER